MNKKRIGSGVALLVALLITSNATAQVAQNTSELTIGVRVHFGTGGAMLEKTGPNSWTELTADGSKPFGVYSVINETQQKINLRKSDSETLTIDLGNDQVSYNSGRINWSISKTTSLFVRRLTDSLRGLEHYPDRAHLRGQRTASATDLYHKYRHTNRSHIQGMGVRGSQYFFTYSENPKESLGHILGHYGRPERGIPDGHMDFIREDIHLTPEARSDLDSQGRGATVVHTGGNHPSGMQIHGDRMVVALSSSLLFYEFDDQNCPKYIGQYQNSSVTAGYAGIAKIDNSKYQVVTASHLITVDLSTKTNFDQYTNFDEQLITPRLPTSDGGMALLSHNGEFAVLCFLDNSKSSDGQNFGVAMYSLRRNSSGQGFTSTKEIEVSLPFVRTLDEWSFKNGSIYREHKAPYTGGDWRSACFRWGATAQIKDGQLEVFAAPRHFHHAPNSAAADVMCWSAGLNLSQNSTALGTAIRQNGLVRITAVKNGSGTIDIGGDYEHFKNRVKVTKTGVSYYLRNLNSNLDSDVTASNILIFTNHSRYTQPGTPFAITDGPAWKAFLEQGNWQDNQLWKFNKVSGLGGALKYGEQVKISRKGKDGVFLTILDDRYLGLTTDEAKATVWQIDP